MAQRRLHILQRVFWAFLACVAAAAFIVAGAGPGRASQADVILNGDFDTSNCAVQKCEFWTFGGSAKIVSGIHSNTSGQALAFGSSESLGSAMQQISLHPGSYKLSFRFFKSCADGMHSLTVVSVGRTIVLTRMFASSMQCGWQRVSKQVYLQAQGDEEFLVRVRSFEQAAGASEFLIDSIELVAE